ncbi:hypothetical protein [Rhodopirellula sallentina]|uniref:Uncharacterized protein n=1 Tax=Rhodopirellula sallentina SM41 TaxID=1263870 RepID=M5TUX7_9BACT|nr:hypothetical protein [Rhodopirellula sallentina]EMI52997.1 hypothetical protein RSSM_05551 [Rhodopirellula sallentina SM41]
MSEAQTTMDVSNDWSSEPWSRVKEAIHTRWSHIDEQELHTLPCNRDAVEKFLNEYTKASPEEIQSVVREFAPAPSLLEQVSHTGEQITEQVTPQLNTAVDRVRYEVDEHPGTITGLAFVGGLALGVLATAAYFRARPQPTPYQQLIPPRWR